MSSPFSFSLIIAHCLIDTFYFRVERTQLQCRNADLMRKLRSLWSSHKKYCTTLALPLRSYTPLSSYPYSRSTTSDINRTLLSSTPYSHYTYNRNKALEDTFDSPIEKVGNISTSLSYLSINKIDDFNDDIDKVGQEVLGFA